MKICIKNPFSFTIFGGFLKKASLVGGAFVLKKPGARGNAKIDLLKVRLKLIPLPCECLFSTFL
jgi:hypothetical protein